MFLGSLNQQLKRGEDTQVQVGDRVRALANLTAVLNDGAAQEIIEGHCGTIEEIDAMMADDGALCVHFDDELHEERWVFGDDLDNLVLIDETGLQVTFDDIKLGLGLERHSEVLKFVLRSFQTLSGRWIRAEKEAVALILQTHDGEGCTGCFPSPIRSENLRPAACDEVEGQTMQVAMRYFTNAPRVEQLALLHAAMEILSCGWIEHDNSTERALETNVLRGALEETAVASGIQVTITMIDGTELAFQFGDDELVQHVKGRIEKEQGIPAVLQELVHDSLNKPLKNGIAITTLLPPEGRLCLTRPLGCRLLREREPDGSSVHASLALSLVRKPHDEHFHSVVLLLTPEAPHNVNKATGKEVSNQGVVLDASHQHAYESSFNFASQRDVGFLVPWCPDFDFGSGDFTIEAWVRLEPGIPTEDINVGNGGPNPMIFSTGWFSNTPIDLYCRAMWTQPPRSCYLRYDLEENSDDGLFHHYALVRHSDHLMMFLDGILKTKRVPYSGVFDSRRNLFVGSTNNSEPHGPAHMSEFRISKGIARYHDDFEPPSAFPIA